MALTPSTMMDLGTKAPEFKLPDVVTGDEKATRDLIGPVGTLIMFICKHCPYVIHVQNEIASIAYEYSPKGIGFVGISSNDIINYPDDSPEQLKKQAEEVGFHFPYLYDESQEVAQAYDAACTPDFFLFDSDSSLVYRGRLDDSRPNNEIPVTGIDLRDALDRLISNQPQKEDQYPSMGCNIKWKN